MSGAPSIQQLVEQAEELLTEFDTGGAVELLNTALKIDPSNTAALDLMGQTMLEVGDAQQAEKAFERSVQLAPEDNPAKWMSLGQLKQGADALRCFDKGIKVMQAEMKSLQAQPKTPEVAAQAFALSMQISTGFCSMAEIYTTDCCDEPNAESECERLLQAAVGACAQNPDAFYALVNLRLIQGKQADAKRYLSRALQLLRKSDEASYETKLNVAKACIETEQYNDAAELLEALLEEDERMAEVWYLAALVYHRLSRKSDAQEAIEKTLQLLMAEPDEEIQAATAELQEAVASLPDDDDAMDDDQGDGEGSEDGHDDTEMSDAH